MRALPILLMLFMAAVFSAPVLAQTSPTPTPPPPQASASTPQGYFEHARLAFEKNDLDATIFNCRMALSMKSDFVDAHYMLGKAYLFRAAGKNRLSVRDFGLGTPETRYLKQYVKGREDLQQAIKHFEQAVRLVPDDIDAMLNLAIAQDNYGKDNEAIKTYEKTIALDPISTHARDAYNNLGLVYASQENFKQAKKAYEGALKIDPTFSPSKLNLQRLLKIRPEMK